MIVTCSSCQTRFRIGDDRIGPQGARVRCSRCKAVFVVRRPDASATPAPALPGDGAQAAAEPTPPPPLPRPPLPPPGGIDLDLSADPFAPPPPRPPPGSAAPPPLPPSPPPAADPFATAAQVDPFAADTAPLYGGTPPPGDPFAPAAGSRPPVPFAAPPPNDPFAPASDGSAGTGSGGLSLEEAVGRRPTPAPTLAALDAEPSRADFRTPGPSGLEVAELPPPAPPPPIAPPPPPPRAEPPAPAPAAPAATRDEPLSATTRTGTEATPVHRRGLASLVLNSLSLALLLAVAAALYAFWVSEGHPVRDLAKVLAARRQAPYNSEDLSSGLYDTARGKPVLFIRGRLLARTPLPGPVAVRVELVDGDRAVARGEGVAGASPTPEEIWSLAGPGEIEGLRAALAARAPRGMAPGEARPFLVVLWDYPADLRGLEVKVTAVPGPG